MMTLMMPHELNSMNAKHHIMRTLTLYTNANHALTHTFT